MRKRIAAVLFCGIVGLTGVACEGESTRQDVNDNQNDRGQSGAEEEQEIP